MPLISFSTSSQNVGLLGDSVYLLTRRPHLNKSKQRGTVLELKIKYVLALLIGTQFLCFSAHAKLGCENYFINFNSPKFANIDKSLKLLNPQDMAVLETLAYMHLGHNSIAEFKRRGFLDFQFYSVPNYTPKGREKDLHYKLMMHYPEYTQTIIYNSVRFQIVESSSRSTW